MSSQKPATGENIDAQPPSAGDDSSSRSSVGSGGIPYGEWSDIDLVKCLVDESGDAYAELYRRHSGSVRAAARMILVRDSRCEDVVAEVFVALWFLPEKFDPSRGSLLAYLRMKARGRSIDIVRTEMAMRRREFAESQSRVEDDRDADASLIASEDARAVREALDQLTPVEREPIYLAFFCGMSYKAVAARLALPEGTVKGRIRAGLSHLQSSEGMLLYANRDQKSVGEVSVHGGDFQKAKPSS